MPASPILKSRRAFRLLGTDVKRVDAPAIVTGRAEYGLDVRVPGMRVAVVERSARLGATIVRVDDAAARAVLGVRHVVRLSSGLHPGIAVVADDTWSALRGRDVLKVEWSPGLAFDSDAYIASLPAELDRATYEVRREGDAAAAVASAARRHEATYTWPFHAHAPVETLTCTAHVRAGRAELWLPTQTDVRTFEAVTKVTGIPADRITLHCTLVGGAFGRRLFADFAAEAAELSQAVGVPVQVLWTRQDDMRHGYFHPASAERFTAGLDAGGAITGLLHRTTATALTIYDIHGGRNLWKDPPKPPPAADWFAKDQNPWGAYDTPYAFPHLDVSCVPAESPVPTGPWRAVWYPSTVFGRESFLDELAHLASRDPIAFRLSLLPPVVRAVGPYHIDQGRLAHVLERVRDLSAWERPLAARAGRRAGRGVAANVYNGSSYIALVAEASVGAAGDVRVDRVVTSIDCGVVLNRLGVMGQAESGIAWGLSATLGGKIDFRNGAAVQGTYADFAVLRIDDMPQLVVDLVDSDANPGGFGEHPVPLVAPAVANAVFAATGSRVRSVPITPAALLA